MSYDEKFYDSIRDTTIRSAQTVVPIVMMRLQQVGIPVRSVIDVGGGQGWWAREFKNCGATGVLCVDGAYVKGCDVAFVPVDLAKPLLHGRYSLAVCLEVGEHLPPSSAHLLVAELTKVAPVVLFSAAIPEQGGENHINEQPPSYWSAQFQTNAFAMSGFLRDIIWDDTRVASWYRQNLMLAISSDLMTSNNVPIDFWTDVPPKERIHPATGNPRLKE